MLLSLLAWQRAGAQLAPPEDFFNSGAQFYISNNIPSALERVELGLKTYPSDEKLKKLEELLKQKQQQQQDQQNQQQQNQQKKSDDQKQSQDKKDQQQNQDQKQQDQQKNSGQQKKDQDKKDEQKQNQPDQKKDEDQKNPEDQKKDEGDKPKDEKQDQQTGQPVKPGEMTPEEAKKLLEAQKGREQLLPMKPDGKPRDPNRPVKDW